MQFTLRTDYALRALIYLALTPPGPVSAAVIADAYGISHSHLVKVVQALVALGLAETRPGRGGGVVIARPPEEIRIGDVVRAMEPDFALVECFAPTGACRITPMCGLIRPLTEARGQFLDVLDRYTLADCLGAAADDLRRQLGIDPAPA